MQQAEKIVVAKPVASRPYSNFRFSPLHHVGSTSTSPTPLSLSEAVVATRPKNWMFKSSTSDSAAEVDSSLDNLSGSAACYTSDEVPVTATGADLKSTILYKPTTQAVSRTTAAFWRKLGHLHTSDGQLVTDMQAPDQAPDQATYHFYNHPTHCLYHYSSPPMEMSQICEPDSTSQSMGQDMRAEQPQCIRDRSSYDGYSWRKYGQKQVKGSEFPRSYYKCTHPNCPAKKKVEGSVDGQIAEIVYSGEHNHPKPQLQKQLSSGSQGHEKDNGNPWSSSPLEKKESNKTMEHHNEVCFTGIPTYPEKFQLSHNSLVTTKYSDSTKNPDTAGRRNEVCEVGNREATLYDEKPYFKRRKNENQVAVPAAVIEGVAEPRSSMQTFVESDFFADGSWRKYGRKVVKGNSRSSYRCTNSECNARKYVERTSGDSGTFITTYEGKHSHDMPTREMNLLASEHDTLALINNALHNLNT